MNLSKGLVAFACLISTIGAVRLDDDDEAEAAAPQAAVAAPSAEDKPVALTHLTHVKIGDVAAKGGAVAAPVQAKEEAEAAVAKAKKKQLQVEGAGNDKAAKMQQMMDEAIAAYKADKEKRFQESQGKKEKAGKEASDAADKDVEKAEEKQEKEVTAAAAAAAQRVLDKYKEKEDAEAKEQWMREEKELSDAEMLAARARAALEAAKEDLAVDAQNKAEVETVVAPALAKAEAARESVKAATKKAAAEAMANQTNQTAESKSLDHLHTPCAKEHGICMCKNGTVIYGRRWLEGEVRTLVQTRMQSVRVQPCLFSLACSNVVFGDPAPGFEKHCFCQLETDNIGVLQRVGSGVSLIELEAGAVASHGEGQLGPPAPPPQHNAADAQAALQRVPPLQGVDVLGSPNPAPPSIAPLSGSQVEDRLASGPGPVLRLSSNTLAAHAKAGAQTAAATAAASPRQRTEEQVAGRG